MDNSTTEKPFNPHQPNINVDHYEYLLRKLDLFLYGLRERNIDVEAFKRRSQEPSSMEEAQSRIRKRKKKHNGFGIQSYTFTEYRNILAQIEDAKIPRISKKERKAEERREYFIAKKEEIRLAEGRAKPSVQELRDMPYEEYLKTEHWLMIRQRSLKEAKHACRLCNSKQTLHVHHRSYVNRGQEQSYDVVVLCKACHDQFHRWHGKIIDR